MARAEVFGSKVELKQSFLSGVTKRVLTQRSVTHQLGCISCQRTDAALFWPGLVREHEKEIDW
jgi:hypothetical protein